MIAGAVARGGDDVILRLALRGRELDAGVGEDLSLEIELGKVAVGEQHLRHRTSFAYRTPAREDPPATRNGTGARVDGQVA
jgi:hypothetical protein